MKKLFVLAAATMLLQAPLSHANFTDPCVGPNYQSNSWLLEINREDQSTREGLLQTLDLLGRGGFSLTHVFAFDGGESKTVVVKFNPGYWVEGINRANEIKNKTLGELANIPGNSIHCNGIFRPARF